MTSRSARNNRIRAKTFKRMMAPLESRRKIFPEKKKKTQQEDKTLFKKIMDRAAEKRLEDPN